MWLGGGCWVAGGQVGGWRSSERALPSTHPARPLLGLPPTSCRPLPYAVRPASPHGEWVALTSAGEGPPSLLWCSKVAVAWGSTAERVFRPVVVSVAPPLQPYHPSLQTVLVNAAGILERCNEQTLPALYKVRVLWARGVPQRSACGRGVHGIRLSISDRLVLCVTPPFSTSSLCPLEHHPPPTPIATAQYVGRSFRASPRRLGYITLACALVQAVFAPVGGKVCWGGCQAGVGSGEGARLGLGSVLVWCCSMCGSQTGAPATSVPPSPLTLNSLLQG